MRAGEKLGLEQIRAFLEATEEVRFEGRDREEVYGWVNETLRGQGYQDLKRSGRGLVRRYIEKTTGLSRAQTTRLITLYREGEEVRPKVYRRRRFPQRYTRGGCRFVGGGGQPSRDAERAGDGEDYALSVPRFRGSKVSTVGRPVGGTVVSATAKPAIPAAPCGLSSDSADAGGHRLAAAAEPNSRCESL
jgi:hypothetical protein